MKKSIISNLSMITLLVITSVIIYARFQVPNWHEKNVLAILSWDVFGYYLYLPAKFIYNDLGIHNFLWVQDILTNYHPTMSFYQAYPGPIEDYIMKYPVGMAILYTPFFFIGHFFAHLFNFPADGFSLPYQFSISMGALCYTLVGLWFFRKILLSYFDELTSSVAMILVALGTNYFELTAFDGAMPHNILFMLYALVVWFTIRWHECPSLKYAIPLGLLIGLCIIVRPTSGIIILIPILWNQYNYSSLKAKFILICHNWMHLAICAIGIIFIVAIQLVYWKIQSGQWLYYSYEKTEKLEWIAPYLWKVLFSYKKGWLIYTPIMFFIFPGFYFLFKKNRGLFISIISFFIIHLLLVSSWPTWWYGGSFGQRTMMESYLLLSLPIAAFIQSIYHRTTFINLTINCLLFSLIILNLFQTWQYINHILPPNRITKQYYWIVFGSTSVKEADLYYLEPEDSNDPEQCKDLSGYNQKMLVNYDFEDFDTLNPGAITNTVSLSGKHSFHMNSQVQFSPGLTTKYRDLTSKEFVWIKATGNVYFMCTPENVKCCLVITSLRDGKAHKYKMLALETLNLKPLEWNKVTMEYLTPYTPNRNDTLQSYFWYRGESEVFIDDFTLTLFEPIEK